MKHGPPTAKLFLLCISVFSLLKLDMCGEDIAMMSLAEASDFIKKAEIESPGAVKQYVDDAIRAKRLDVLAYFWEGTTYGRHFFVNELYNMPESRTKSEFALIILKSPVTNRLFSEGGLRSMEDMRKNFAEKFIPILRNTIPDIPIDYDAISTMEKRRNLAEKMERALGLGSETPENAKRVWPPKPGDKPGAPSAPPPQDGAASQPNASAPIAIVDKAGESTPLPGGWALWGGIAAVLAAAAGWLLLCSKRKKG